MGYKKRVTPGGLQQRLGVAWPPAHRFVARYGFGSAVIRDPDDVDRWTVSEETADAIVAAFKEERNEAFQNLRRPGRSEREHRG